MSVFDMVDFIFAEGVTIWLLLSFAALLAEQLEFSNCGYPGSWFTGIFVKLIGTFTLFTPTGLETWFTLPDLKTLSQSPPPRWKMAIVIFFAAYAISSLSRYILNPYIAQWPILGNAVIYSAILVVSLTYFALPIGNSLLLHWLYLRSI